MTYSSIMVEEGVSKLQFYLIKVNGIFGGIGFRGGRIVEAFELS